MKTFLDQFAKAMDEINRIAPGHNNNENQYQPGIGPYGEDEIVDLVMNNLQASNAVPQTYFVRPDANERRELGLENYRGISNRAATPDLILGNKIIEFKICRPLRDNGNREDTWFKKVFEPNPESYSTFLDVAKLCRFRDQHDQRNLWERWVTIIGFERINETEYMLDKYFPGLFEYISDRMVSLPFVQFESSTAILGDRHPYHQVAKLYAFRY